jgi:cytochrome c oxidase subunit 2
VIHSFWIPALAGKIDMLPDRMEQIRLQADRPGVYRGQCAEYCGTQHARMVLHVVAMPEPEFEAWLRNEAQPQAQSADPRLERGRQIFLELRCAACHTVRGVAQSIELGPDLTHLGSRLTLAAGTLPMDERRLAEWIADPQALKPGARMPSYTHVEPQALSLLAAYLEQLR